MSKELRILVTNADKTGDDIRAMSNFLDLYANELSVQLEKQTEGNSWKDIPASDFSIISNAIAASETVFKGAYSYVLDYNSLPANVRNKLKSGEYRLGESRQVEGNARAVIVDETGTRVKDITLKQVRNDQETIRAANGLAEQIQMRQVYVNQSAVLYYRLIRKA